MATTTTPSTIACELASSLLGKHKISDSSSPILGLPQMRVRGGRLKCSSEKQPAESSNAHFNIGTSLLAAAAVVGSTACPAMALVDERMSTEGTGLTLGISNNILGWILLGVFGTIWALYFIYVQSLDEDEDSDGLSL